MLKKRVLIWYTVSHPSRISAAGVDINGPLWLAVVLLCKRQ